MTKDEFLNILTDLTEDSERWLNNPNTVFDNQCPADMLETEEGLMKLQQMVEFINRDSF